MISRFPALERLLSVSGKYINDIGDKLSIETVGHNVHLRFEQHRFVWHGLFAIENNELKLWWINSGGGPNIFISTLGVDDTYNEDLQRFVFRPNSQFENIEHSFDLSHVGFIYYTAKMGSEIIYTSKFFLAQLA